MPHDSASHGIEETPTGVTLRIHVAPRSSANKVLGTHNGAIKIALTAPPVEGAANKSLIEFLAKTLQVPKNAVILISGETSRYKVVRILGISGDTASQLLELL